MGNRSTENKLNGADRFALEARVYGKIDQIHSATIQHASKVRAFISNCLYIVK